MEFYRGVISPILDHLDSEIMHTAVRDTLHLAETIPGGVKLVEQFSFGRQRFTDPRLNTTVGGVKLDNPVMVGAGWDKKGVAVRGLYTLGFSGVEVGSVLRDPQPGNPNPRQFYRAGAALNRLGFNSPGMHEVAANLLRYRNKNIGIVGISIGKNKDVTPENAPKAHAEVAELFADLHKHKMIDVSYYTVNVSSPNTPGLRELQDKRSLTDIVQAVNQTLEMFEANQPVFVKIAPDLTYEAIDDVITVAVDNRLAGIIACNTTIDENLKTRYGWGGEAGGLSGDDRDYVAQVDRIIAHIFRNAGDRLDIIGVGGVNSTQRVIDKIRAGAKAVQVVTGIRQVGPTLPGRINKGLARFLDLEGTDNLSKYVGKGAYKIPH